MYSQPRFIDLVLAGEVVDPETAIEGWIQRWHESDSDGTLHDWLGMTWDEYALFVEKPEFLRAIFAARQHGVSLMSTVELASDAQAKLAARGVPSEDVPKLRTWLEETGRL
jgi:hypothetical protein